MNNFELLEADDEFESFILDLETGELRSLNTVQMINKAELEELPGQTSARTRRETYAEFASLTIQRKLKASQRQQVSIDTMQTDQIDAAISGLQTRLTDQAKAQQYANYPPFKEGAPAAEVFPLDGLLTLDVKSYAAKNPDAVSELYALAVGAPSNDMEPRMFDAVQPVKACRELAPEFCKTLPQGTEPSAALTLLVGLVGAYKRDQPPYMAKYVAQRFQGNAVKSPKVIVIILALAGHLTQQQFNLNALAKDLKKNIKELEEAAHGLGLKIDGQACRVPEKWKLPVPTADTRKSK